MSRVPSGLPAGFSLEAEWEVYRTPFQHVCVRGVFERQTYEAMQQAFRDLRGDDEVRWVRTSSYDAQVLAMNDSLRQRFAGLFDPAFLAYAAELAGGIRTVPLLDGALHHIPQGSRSGWLHTDLCSAWFSNSEGVSAVKAAFADRTQCDYFSGVPRKPEVTPKEFVRAASLLFYLNNAGWEDGDGGETEIYSAGRSDAGPRKTVSPEDNTLLVFENSPHSFHRMIANPGRARNSIVLWLHTDLEFGLSRWGSGVAREGRA